MQQIVDALISDTYTSLDLFRPELVLCVTIVLMLLSRLFRVGRKIDPCIIAFLGAGYALYCAVPMGGLAEVIGQGPQEIFTGMLVYDSMSVYVRALLLVFALLFIVLTRMTGLADSSDGQDFYTLVLGAILGMCIMTSANHLMTVFLGVEMASVPSYVLAGAVKGRRRASEAALKYAVYGAGTAGVMLYGISLLAGVLGTAHLPSIATALATIDFSAAEQSGKVMVLALAGLMIMVGLAFKLSAVPFHFWCPDVFEGASAEVNAFLSVASKAAALALLIRVAMGVTAPQAADVAFTAPPASPFVLVAQATDAEEATQIASAGSSVRNSPVRNFVVVLLAILSAITCTFGNLAAYAQTNIKRLLAYSTIAHAGYMIMPVAAAVQLAGTNPAQANEAISAVLFYVGVYLFMNLGAFSIIAFLRNTMQSEEIADYGGLMRSAPLTAFCLTAIMFSLIGLPPLGGFWAKAKAFMSLVEAGGPVMMTLLVVGGINTVLSLYYYLRVAKVVCIDPEPESRGPVSMPMLPVAFILLVSLPVVILGLIPETLANWARMAGL